MWRLLTLHHSSSKISALNSFSSHQFNFKLSHLLFPPRHHTIAHILQRGFLQRTDRYWHAFFVLKAHIIDSPNTLVIQTHTWPKNSRLYQVLSNNLESDWLGYFCANSTTKHFTFPDGRRKHRSLACNGNCQAVSLKWQSCNARTGMATENSTRGTQRLFLSLRNGNRKLHTICRISMKRNTETSELRFCLK